ncbi:MAG: hypothetical protein KGI19_07205 [Thaumarchaeota archaeon]|nr:hypothetical protein [Nitrososphaerota archaeon]
MDSLRPFLKDLYRKNKTEFRRLFFLTEFASRVDIHSIQNRIPDEIRSKYAQAILEKRVSYDELLLPVYKYDKELLTGMLYDSLITKSPFKTYKTVLPMDAEIFLNDLNKEKVEELFSDLKKAGVLKNMPKVWWFENRFGKTKIFSRVESKKRHSIHLVSRNTFLKTAGDRAMIFSDKGNLLNVLTKRADAVAKWADTIMTIGLKKRVVYIPITLEYDHADVKGFIEKVRNNSVEKFTLLGLERKNAPLINSPILRIESKDMGSVTDSIKELEEHNVPIISDIENITQIILGIGGKPYKFSLELIDEKMTLHFDNRHLPEMEKDKIRQLINEAISAK